MIRAFGGLLLLSLGILASASSAAPPLSDYVGKYPRDSVAGVPYLKHPTLVRLVESATTNATVRARVLTAGVAGPVYRSRGMIVAWGCQPHNCNWHSWTIVVRGPDGPAAVCYFDAELMRGPVWFVGGRKLPLMATQCPHEPSELPAAIQTVLAKG